MKSGGRCQYILKLSKLQFSPHLWLTLVFTEGSFLLLNGQKHFRSVAEDLISNKQKEVNEFIKNGKGTDIIKLSSQYFSRGYHFADDGTRTRNPSITNRVL